MTVVWQGCEDAPPACDLSSACERIPLHVTRIAHSTLPLFAPDLRPFPFSFRAPLRPFRSFDTRIFISGFIFYCAATATTADNSAGLFFFLPCASVSQMEQVGL